MFDWQTFNESIVSQLKKIIEERFGPEFVTDLNFDLEPPPQPEMGDLSWSVFSLAKKLKKEPKEVAEILVLTFQPNGIIEKMVNVGPYLNFFLHKEKWFSFVLQDILIKKEKFGETDINQNKTVLIEFSSPNTNKPQHLGHGRNNFLGACLANLLKNFGFKTIRANLINDRGIHICKSMLAYQKWGQEETPEEKGFKGDHLVGKFYSLFEEKNKENPNLLTEAQELLKKWEDGDEETIVLWQKINHWAIQGLKETYQKLGIEFDEWTYESEIYKLGKEIVLNFLEKGICSRRPDGAVEIDLSSFNLGKKILIRADGTSVYITQDIGLAKLRADHFKPDLVIYVVGAEQEHYFKVLFKILEIFGYEWAKKCYHLSYGLVFLPTGKMKSRQGNVVEIDNLLIEIKRLAKEEILKRQSDISPMDLEARAEKIALASLKFFFLRHTPQQNIYFEPSKEISFEGATGPYLQYAYARIAGILNKEPIKDRQVGKIDFSVLGNKEEVALLKIIFNFQKILEKAVVQYNPALLANYLLDLAQSFHKFYHQHQVLKSKKKIKIARLALIEAVAIILKKGLSLLGIETLERM